MPESGSQDTVAAPDAHVALFGHWICPYSVRVSYALGHRAIDHTVVEVPPTAVRPAGFVVPDEFLAHSPRHEIPLVRVGGKYRADSLPILEWLEECFGDRPLLPHDEEGRTAVRARMAWIDEHVFAAMIGVYYGSDDGRIARAAATLTEALRAMGEWLDHAPWLAGDAPTLADATVVPLYVRFGALGQLGFRGPVDPRVVAHVERCTDLDGWDAVAWTPAQTEEFVGRITRHRERAGRSRAG